MVAWTQYGLFRRAIFDAGVRFDETTPFDGAGWGFEDNDLAFQMDLRGYVNQRFFGMTYLHRDVRSSIRIMRTPGHRCHRSLCTAQAVCHRQMDGAVPQINQGPLELIRRISMSL